MEQAFDNLSLEEALWALEHGSAPPKLTAAILTEMLDNTCEVGFQEIKTSRKISGLSTRTSCHQVITIS